MPSSSVSCPIPPQPERKDLMLTTTAPNAAPPNSSPGALFRLLRIVVAVGASVLAVSCAAILLGAYVPAVPKAGLVGPVLAGQYPLHLALIAGVGLGMALVAWRAGLVRWGRVLTVITSACVVAVLVIVAVQVGSATRAGTDISWSSPFTEPGYPAVTADETTTYARPEGAALDVDVYLPPATERGRAPAIVLAHAGGFRTFDKATCAEPGAGSPSTVSRSSPSTTGWPRRRRPPGTRLRRTWCARSAGSRTTLPATASTPRECRSAACRPVGRWRWELRTAWWTARSRPAAGELRHPGLRRRLLPRHRRRADVGRGRPRHPGSSRVVHRRHAAGAPRALRRAVTDHPSATRPAAHPDGHRRSRPQPRTRRLRDGLRKGARRERKPGHIP